jgi:hypothetical protein
MERKEAVQVRRALAAKLDAIAAKCEDVGALPRKQRRKRNASPKQTG